MGRATWRTLGMLLAPPRDITISDRETRHKTDSANSWWAVSMSIIPLVLSCEQQLSLSYSSWSLAVDSVLWLRSLVGRTSSIAPAVSSSSKYSGLSTAVGDVATSPSHFVSSTNDIISPCFMWSSQYCTYTDWQRLNSQTLHRLTLVICYYR